MSLPGENKDFKELKEFYKTKEKEEVSCPLCGGFNNYVLSRKGYPGVNLINVICRNCGLIRINPRMKKEVYDEFYQKYFFEYLDPYSRPAYLETINRTADENFVTPVEKTLFPFIIDYIPEGADVLDVGAGFGNILYLLERKKNIKATGLEPDPHSREIAFKKLGLRLLDITIEDFLKKENYVFDFIILDQTLEHLLNPLEILKGLKVILKPEGLIYIGVPNSYNPQIPIKLFFQLAHVFNFTPHTLNLFAQKSGLKIVKITGPEDYALGVIMSRQESSYSAVKKESLKSGSDWQEIVKILKRKRRLNLIRGITKRILNKIVGNSLIQKLKKIIDKIIHYKY